MGMNTRVREKRKIYTRLSEFGAKLIKPPNVFHLWSHKCPTYRLESNANTHTSMLRSER